MTAKVISGGSKLAAALKKLSEKVSNASTVSVGFLEGAQYPDGTSVPMVAAIQEYGAPRAGIPARPFFRPMVAEKKGTWGDALGRNLVAQDYDAARALDAMGQGIVPQLKDSIRNLDEPALSNVTLMLRAMFPVSSTHKKTYADIAEARRLVAAGESWGDVSTKPLIWTGDMLAAVKYEVTST